MSLQKNKGSIEITAGGIHNPGPIVNTWLFQFIVRSK